MSKENVKQVMIEEEDNEDEHVALFANVCVIATLPSTRGEVFASNLASL